MNLISLENVTKSYLNKVFNFNIKKGENLLIVGENGSGKSTLIKLITNYIIKSSGLIKSEVKKISYLEEVIELPLNMKVSNYIKTMEFLKSGVVDKVLSDVFKVPLDKYIFELSKGNRQKLAILITFLGNNDLYVLDEPLNGLDESMINFFINYLKERTETIILVTHYPEKYLLLNSKIVSL